MALKLESKIMEEIGLGAHYSWYNGSYSCRYIRQEAADKVADVIQKHKDAGEEIASPDRDLILTLQRIAKMGEDNDCSLTKTWEAASYVIAAHIHQARTSDQDKLKAYTQLREQLGQEYLAPQSHSRGFLQGLIFGE